MSLLAVADDGPISYLCEIGHIELLPRLFGEVHIPAAVYLELCHPKTPAVIRDWALKPPPWLKIASTLEADDPSPSQLDAGERAAGRGTYAKRLMINILWLLFLVGAKSEFHANSHSDGSTIFHGRSETILADSFNRLLI